MSSSVRSLLALTWVACLAVNCLITANKIHFPSCSLNFTALNPVKPLSNYSSQLVEGITLDVFSVLSNSDPKEFPYIANGEVWLNFHLIKSLNKNPKSLIRFHFFTDSQHIMDQGIELGYFMHDMRNLTKLNDHFMRMYRPNHHSINTVEYEYLCFYRWHMYRHAIDAWQDDQQPITNIITMDSDVLIVFDPVEFYVRAVEALGFQNENSSSNFELAVISAGAFHIIL